MDNKKIIDYALNFLLVNIDETTEEDLGMTWDEIENEIDKIKINLYENDNHVDSFDVDTSEGFYNPLT
jgi:hypothetical protein